MDMADQFSKYSKSNHQTLACREKFLVIRNSLEATFKRMSQQSASLANLAIQPDGGAHRYCQSIRLVGAGAWQLTSISEFWYADGSLLILLSVPCNSSAFTYIYSTELDRMMKLFLLFHGVETVNSGQEHVDVSSCPAGKTRDRTTFHSSGAFSYSSRHHHHHPHHHPHRRFLHSLLRSQRCGHRLKSLNRSHFLKSLYGRCLRRCGLRSRRRAHCLLCPRCPDQCAHPGGSEHL